MEDIEKYSMKQDLSVETKQQITAMIGTTGRRRGSGSSANFGSSSTDDLKIAIASLNKVGLLILPSAPVAFFILA